MSIVLTAPSGSVLLGNALILTATVSDSANTAVTWSVAGVLGGNNVVGTIADGVFTAPQVLPSPATVSVTATSTADPTKSATTSITIASDIGVVLVPPNAGVELGARQNFQAAITSAGKPSTAVSWAIRGTGCAGNACGTVDSTGVFTAPPILPSPATVLLTATSAADPSKAATTAVTVTSRFALTLSGPSSVTVSSMANFAALLTPVPGSNPSPTIDWSVSGPNCTELACGNVAESGVGATASYNAPATPTGPITITATPVADPSKSQSMQVAVSLGIEVTLSPTTATVVLGAGANFVATVTGSSDPSVTWDVNGVTGGNATLGTIVANPANVDVATYSAPQNLPATNPVSVRARSNASPNAMATAQVTLRLPSQVSLVPATASLIAGQRQTFTAQAADSANVAVTWQVNGMTGGSTLLGQVCAVNSNPCQTVTSAPAGSVDYLAPAAVPSTNPVTLTVVNQADATQTASSTIAILPHIEVSVAPPSITLAPGASQLFTASVSGSTNQQVTWNISGSACDGASASCGTIDATGLYLAPPSAPAPNSFNIVATSSVDTSQTGLAEVTIATTPIITSLLPSSAVAGAAGGFTLRVAGANFAASNPGPGSAILISGATRTAACDTVSACSTTLTESDLQSAANLNVVVQNPNGSTSKSTVFVVLPASGAPANIPVTDGAPAAAGQDIVVVDLSTNGSSAPAQDVSLNLVAIGSYQPASASCSLGGGPVTLLRPASGTATADLCAFSVSGLDPAAAYAVSGPTPGDIVISGTEPLGLGIIHLTLQVPAAAKTGARSLLIQNANRDLTVGSGAIDVR